MANQVSNFQFQNNALRVIVVNGEPWFLAADVCRIIGITSPTKAVKILDDDEVALKTFQGLTNGNDEANFISESGMYKIVMRSQDAIKQGTPAHAFTKWVTSEVLPAIRKTGSYSVSISKAQQGELATLIAERFPSGKDRPYAWSRFNNHFRLASYKDLPTNRFEEACEYIGTMPEPVPALQRPAVNLLDKDYFAKVRDIAIKFADDWVRVGKGEDVQPTLTIPDDVLAGIIAQQLSRQNFRLYVDYAGHLNVDAIPNKSPYEGLAEAIADPGNIGLPDELIEEIGAACVKALAYRAQQRKSIISRTRGAK
nr:MAG TPA: repressor domain protein [Caudoviricetes sp.]